MDNQTIAKVSFDLLAREPSKGGLTIQLTGGGPDIVVPSAERAMSPALLAGLGASGLFRSAEVRSEFNLQVFAEEQDGLYNVRVERVTGMSVLTSIPDPSEVVTHFQAGSLTEAQEMLARALAVDDELIGIFDRVLVAHRSAGLHRRTALGQADGQTVVGGVVGLGARRQRVDDREDECGEERRKQESEVPHRGSFRGGGDRAGGTGLSHHRCTVRSG